LLLFAPLGLVAVIDSIQPFTFDRTVGIAYLVLHDRFRDGGNLLTREEERRDAVDSNRKEYRAKKQPMEEILKN